MSFLVILVAGRYSVSVEAINAEGSPLCKLPDLPYEISQHTMDEDTLCGGNSCIYFENGNWIKYEWNLTRGI